jgi:hypothetical protein
VTDTPIGPIRFVGVCIPWRDAHVRTGRRDRAPWEDHLRFLEQARIMQLEASPFLEVAAARSTNVPSRSTTSTMDR